MKVNTQKMKAALAALLKINSTRMTLPILSCVKLTQEGTVLTLCASNLDESQSEIVECNGKLPEMCVNLKYLASAVGVGEETALECVDGYLSIMPAGVELQILKPEEFPKSPDTAKMETIAVNCVDLADSISAVKWCTSTDGGRFALEPVHCVGSPKSLYVEAADGRRLAYIEKSCISVDFEILVMRNFCENFCEALKRKGATLRRNGNLLMVQHDDGSYYCKIPEVNYPNTNTVKPEKSREVGVIPTDLIHDAVTLGLRISSTRMVQSANFDFSKSGLRLSFNDPNHSAKMDTLIAGKFIKSGTTLDMRYALDAVNAFKAVGQASIKVDFEDEFSAVKFSAGDLTVLIMPMRGN